MAQLEECYSQPKDYEFETHWRHYVVSFSKTLYSLLSTGSTDEDRKSSRRLKNCSMGCKASTQTKQDNDLNLYTENLCKMATQK